jgi:lysyl-tRNA synthetase class 2
MDDTNSLIEQRKAKLASLRAKGIDPFQNKFTPSESCADARANYAEGRAVALAGRITAHRDMGKSMFVDVKDQSGRLQAYAQKNVLGDEQFHIFSHLDLGDFVGVRGTLFTTRTGEISVKVESFTILAKALRPPPAKWHGLEDTEIRYRQRYLDLMANDDVKRVMLLRSRVIREIRNFLHARGYVEVETPMMQAIPGGAAAQPFITKHNALGCDFYLRIALELYLKRLLVGGVDKVFEIGRNFRNEGLSRKHNPEFTMLEAYEAFGDYETMMDLVQGMVCHVSQEVLDTLVIEHQRTNEVNALITSCIASISSARAMLLGHPNEESVQRERTERMEKIWRTPLEELQKCHSRLNVESSAALAKQAQTIFSNAINAFLADKLSENSPLDWANADHLIWPDFTHQATKFGPLTEAKTINLTPPWQRVRYKDIVRDTVRAKTDGRVADWFALTPEERRRVAIEELKLAGDIGTQYEDFEVTGAVFEKLIEPTLIQPTFVTHLPKQLVPLAKLSPDDPTTVEVFECCINGQEIAPAYTEQNDPIAQREALEHQAGGEQQKLDEDFLTALEHGMPPAGGMGMGIDRLCMMLLGQESIRDVILFPQLKPK